MKKIFSALLSVMIISSLHGQQSTKTRESIEKAKKTFYLKTSFDGRQIVFSDISWDIRQSFRDEQLNQDIEKEIKTQWEEYLAERGFDGRIQYTHLFNNAFSVTGPLSMDKFIALRKKDIDAARKNRETRVDSLYFSYVPSSDIASRLSAEKADLDAMTKLEDMRDESIVKHGATVADAQYGIGALAYRNLENDDEDLLLPWYIKGNIGLGHQDIPVVMNTRKTFNNMPATGSSKVYSTGNLAVNVSLLFSFLNNKMISLKTQPFFNYGFHLSGLVVGVEEKGYHYNYGNTATIAIGKKFKFLLKGEFALRSGSIYQEIDLNTAGSNSVSKGNADYNYNTIKYGAGLFCDFGGHDNFAELTMYNESLSFGNTSDKQIFSYEAKLSFSLLGLSLQYAPDYPVAGKPQYPNTFKQDKKPFVSVSLYAPLTIFKYKGKQLVKQPG